MASRKDTSKQRCTALCIVKNCKYSNQNSEFEFFKFPKEDKKLNVWGKLAQCEQFIRSLKDRFSDTFRVCENHFQNVMFEKSDFPKKLIPNAVPTLKLPVCIKERDRVVSEWIKEFGVFDQHALQENPIIVRKRRFVDTDPVDLGDKEPAKNPLAIEFVDLSNEEEVEIPSENKSLSPMLDTDAVINVIIQDEDLVDTLDILEKNDENKTNNSASIETPQDAEIVHFEKKKTKHKSRDTNLPVIVLKAKLESQDPIITMARATEKNYKIIMDFVDGKDIWLGDQVVQDVPKTTFNPHLTTNRFVWEKDLMDDSQNDIVEAIDYLSSDEELVELHKNIRPSDTNVQTDNLIDYDDMVENKLTDFKCFKTKTNFSKKCRVCMEEKDHMTDIKDLQKTTDMSSLLTFFDIEVIDYNFASNRICSSCVRQLQCVNNLRIMSTNSLKTMSDILESEALNINETEIETIHNISLNNTNENKAESNTESKPYKEEIIIEEYIEDEFDEKPQFLESVEDSELIENTVVDKFGLQVLDIDSDTDSVINDELEIENPPANWNQDLLKIIAENNGSIRLYYVHNGYKKQIRKRLLKICICCGEKVLFNRYTTHAMAHGESSFPCCLCQQSFKTYPRYIQHLHRSRHYGICSSCSQTIRYYPGKLMKRVTCQSCGTTSKPKNLKHLEVAPNRRGNRLWSRYCYQCMVQTTSETARPTTCSKCGLSFKQTNGLWCTTCNNFLEAKPAGEYVCEKCGTCHELKCEQCDQKFKRLFSYYFHRKYQHVERTLVCHICGITSSTNIGHKNHMDRHAAKTKNQVRTKKKSKERKWKCESCNILFLTKDSLQRHLNSSKHSTARKYVCGCGSRFRFSDNLLKHKRTVHKM